MNDELDDRLHALFAAIEDDAPVARPMPSRDSVIANVGGRPHPAFTFAVAAAALVTLLAGAAVVKWRVDQPSKPATAPSFTTLPATGPSSTGAVTSPSVASAATFPPADPTARNYLVVGSDNHSCADPGSSTAGGFGDRSALGERSDTIMIVRVAPATNHVSILSFPRDLWVWIHGTNGENRIDTAYTVDQPQRLIDTIKDDFGIAIDHYIQLDFCAFKTVIDAVGGVKVPFASAARDTHTGLDVPQPGCVTFDGDQALAYVRSRHYEYKDPTTGTWIEDPTSDLGRIARQQDFLWRALSAALASGVDDPVRAQALISTLRDDVVTDRELTLNSMLQLAGVARDVDPASILNASIDAHSAVIANNAVLIPDLTSAEMRSVLAVFQGDDVGAAPIGSAPSVPAAGTSTPSSFVAAVSNPKGIFPTPGQTC